MADNLSIMLLSSEKESCTERGQNQENYIDKLLAYYFWEIPDFWTSCLRGKYAFYCLGRLNGSLVTGGCKNHNLGARFGVQGESLCLVSFL